MKHILFLFLFLTAISGIVRAQEGFGPTILILSPSNTSSDARLDYEIDWSEKRKIKAAKQRLKLERPFNKEMRHEPENIRIMYKKSKAFSRQMNFYKGISYSLEQYLQYRLLEKFPNTLVYAVKQTSTGDKEELAKIAKSHGMRFIINPVKVHSFVKEEDQKFTTIKFQVYDSGRDTMMLSQTYTGDQKNPGKDFDCQDNSLECTINNAMIPFINDLFSAIFPKNKPAGSAPNKASTK
jgi:hypothetical protein